MLRALQKIRTCCRSSARRSCAVLRWPHLAEPRLLPHVASPRFALPSLFLQAASVISSQASKHRNQPIEGTPTLAGVRNKWYWQWERWHLLALLIAAGALVWADARRAVTLAHAASGLEWPTDVLCLHAIARRWFNTDAGFAKPQETRKPQVCACMLTVNQPPH